jgi:N-acetylglucosamine kinase-like BadF-type ATPase
MVGAGDVMRDILSRLDGIGEIHFHSEPNVALAAALKTGGAVALSGTGSDAFFVKDQKCLTSVGGWGPLLGDEGSGYDIGLNALKAAVYSYDGRREMSMLYDMVMEHWGLERLWEIVSHLAGNPDARHEIASAAVLCTQAAYAGDKAAISIYEHAALEMYRQARVIIEKNRNEWDGTVVITGGAWKGYHRMYDIFKQEITLTYPEARVQKPVFEPLVGCAVLGCLQNGYNLSDLEAPIKQGFADLLYSE